MQFLINLLEAFSVAGPAGAVNSLLLVMIGAVLVALFWCMRDRKRLLNSLGKKDDKIFEIIDKYEEASNSVTNAMHSVREVLIELRALVGKK